MARSGKQSQSERKTNPTTRGNMENKISLPLSYKEAVSAFLKVKPEPKKPKRKE